MELFVLIILAFVSTSSVKDADAEAEAGFSDADADAGLDELLLVFFLLAYMSYSSSELFSFIYSISAPTAVFPLVVFSISLYGETSLIGDIPTVCRLMVTDSSGPNFTFISSISEPSKDVTTVHGPGDF